MYRAACLLMMLLAMPAAANDLTLERIFADPALSGPTPRGVKISPDGKRVGLLRGRPEDRHQLDLWTYDVKSGRLELRVESAQLVPNEQLSDAERARRNFLVRNARLATGSRKDKPLPKPPVPC